MGKVASIIGRKGNKWSPLFTGTASECQTQYKYNKFEGYERIYYLDSSGDTKRKKGAPAKKRKAVPK
tara:strand:- start:1367 stop:1567 length:201 start_codon:yes stop_codon:yes gene_type:complete